MTKSIVSLAFDDGYKSAVKTAYPLLWQYGMEATFYVISNNITSTDPNVNSRYMNRMDLSTLNQNGMEIGAHTRSHPHLLDLDLEDAWHEIRGSKTDLENQGFWTETFAYPYGEWNPKLAKMVREAGFHCARSIIEGINGPETNPYLLRCKHVTLETSINDIKGCIWNMQGGLAWCILMFHQIETEKVLRENKWIYGTTPEVLEQTLEYLQEIKFRVLTVEDGMKKMIRETLRARKENGMYMKKIK